MKITNRFDLGYYLSEVNEVKVNTSTKEVEIYIGDKYYNDVQQNKECLEKAIEVLNENEYLYDIHYTIGSINGGRRGYVLYLQENMED